MYYQKRVSGDSLVIVLGLDAFTAGVGSVPGREHTSHKSNGAKPHPPSKKIEKAFLAAACSSFCRVLFELRDFQIRVPVGTGGEEKGDRQQVPGGMRRRRGNTWPTREGSEEAANQNLPLAFFVCLEAPLALQSCPSVVTMATHSPNRTLGVLSHAPGAILADRALIGLQKRGAGHVIVGKGGGAGTL